MFWVRIRYWTSSDDESKENPEAVLTSGETITINNMALVLFLVVQNVSIFKISQNARIQKFSSISIDDIKEVLCNVLH